MKQRITAGLVAVGLLLCGCNVYTVSGFPKAMYQSAAFSIHTDENLLLTDQSSDDSFDTPVVDIFRFADAKDETRMLIVYSCQYGESPDCYAEICDGTVDGVWEAAEEQISIAIQP